jgi:DNA-directed RNA polymerase specialized sigma24 family protein
VTSSDRLRLHRLVLLARAGDADAWEQVLRWCQPILGAAKRALYLPGDADGADRNAIAVAATWEAVVKWHPSKSGFPYFVNMVVRARLVTAIRAAQSAGTTQFLNAVALGAAQLTRDRQGMAATWDTFMERVADKGKSVESCIEDNELRAMIADLTDRLSPFELICLEMCHMEHRSYTEIAAATRTTAKSVDNALCRAARKGKRIMEREEKS